MSASDVVMNVLRRLEQLAARCQGKGWGAASIEQEVTTVLTHVGSAPTLALDIGANVGAYSRALLARHPTLELHLFEPAPSNQTELARKFGANSRVTINHQALAEFAGQATLFADRPGSGLGSLTQRRLDHHGIAFNDRQPVTVLRFEDYWHGTLGERRIDLAKLDIEGHELAALRGFGAALTSTAVVQFEFGGCNIDTRTYLQDFHYFFADMQFDLFRITPLGSHRIARYRETDECFTTTNFVAVNRRIADLRE